MAIDFTLDLTELLGCIASASAIGTTAFGIVDAVWKGTNPFWNAKRSPMGFKQVQGLIEEFRLENALKQELGMTWETTLRHLFARDPENPELSSLLTRLVKERTAALESVMIGQQSNLIVTSALQAAADARKAGYRRAALLVLIAIGLVGAFMVYVLAASNGAKVTPEQFQAALLWFFLGCVGVPIAPVAKDLASALAGIASRHSVVPATQIISTKQ